MVAAEKIVIGTLAGLAAFWAFDHVARRRLRARRVWNSPEPPRPTRLRPRPPVARTQASRGAPGDTLRRVPVPAALAPPALDEADPEEFPEDLPDAPLEGEGDFERVRNHDDASELAERFQGAETSVDWGTFTDFPGAADEPSELDVMLEHYFATDETPGRFYAVQPGDTPETIARAALTLIGSTRPSRQQILDYIYCFTSATYNLDHYGSTSTSLSFPAKWKVPGLGLGLRAAFLPRNADAIDLMTHGLPVPRTVDEQGRPTNAEASSHGTIWLPPVDPERLPDGVVTCEGFSYTCGTSGLEPDPALLRLLEAC